MSDTNTQCQNKITEYNSPQYKSKMLPKECFDLFLHDDNNNNKFLKIVVDTNNKYKPTSYKSTKPDIPPIQIKDTTENDIEIIREAFNTLKIEINNAFNGYNQLDKTINSGYYFTTGDKSKIEGYISKIEQILNPNPTKSINLIKNDIISFYVNEYYSLFYYHKKISSLDENIRLAMKKFIDVLITTLDLEPPDMEKYNNHIASIGKRGGSLYFRKSSRRHKYSKNRHRRHKKSTKKRRTYKNTR
jgi:hypothetical protein